MGTACIIATRDRCRGRRSISILSATIASGSEENRMEQWQSIAFGALLASLTAVITEFARYCLTRQHARDERKRTFQRDRLLSLLDHIASIENAGSEYLFASKCTGDWKPDPNSKHLLAMAEAVALAQRDWVVLDDALVRDWAEDAANAALGLPKCKSIDDAQDKYDKSSELFAKLTNRIGDLVRGL
jgi:hypothetical protein